MTLVPGFIVAHSHRLEQLTDLVTEFVGNYPLAPLSEEKVLVQSNGIAQWLKINMADKLGISAMVDVTLPARFLWQAYRAVLGDDIPKYSPFDKERLIWRLMRLLPDCWDDPRFEPLKKYTENDPDDRKLYQLAQRLADLFDQYQIYRADWLDAWMDGRESEEVDGENHWQPELWRRLIHDVGSHDIWSNRAALHSAFIEKASSLSQHERPAGLPERLIVFGISALPQQTLEVLNALKGQMQILLCVHNPSKHFWADIVADSDLFNQFEFKRQRMARKEGMKAGLTQELMHTQANPLLASWGKQGRDYIRLLDLFDETREMEKHFNDVTFELFDSDLPITMLNQLQDDILELRAVPESRNLWESLSHPEQDGSIQFHVAHSAQREVEVLHDQLLETFKANETLRPRDIMVMVPDIDTYAPHIQAVFGRLNKEDSRYIPFTIADQGQRHQEPLLKALELLLSPEKTRFTVSDVLELLEVPALCQKLDIDVSDVVELQRWIEQSGVRWGLHASHRNAVGIPGSFEQNSWLFGLRRMLYGYSVGDLPPGSSTWQNILPYSEVAGLSADAAGGLAALLEKIEVVWKQFQSPHSLPHWSKLMTDLLSNFFDASNDRELVLLNRIQAELETVSELAQEAEFSDKVAVNIFREVIFERIETQGLNQRFLAGAVNFATLMPMRAIPFERVYILGMNDGAYPRSRQPYDFDLMADDYRPGDRSRREDDRYLFLEALLSARKYLYISWIGRSIRDNSERPPSVLVSQLRDHLAATWKPEQMKAQEWLRQVTTEHRLQPFHADYFKPDSRLFSYSREWLQEHESTNEHVPQPVDAPTGELSIRDLKYVLEEPCRVFCNRRLGVWFGDQSSAAQDDEVIAPDNLQTWALNNSILTTLNVTLLGAHAHTDYQPFCSEDQPSTLAEELEQAFERQLIRLEAEGKIGIGAVAVNLKRELREKWQPVLAEMAAAHDFSLGTDPILLRHEHEGIVIDDVTMPLKVSVIISNTGAVGKHFNWKHVLFEWIRHLLINKAKSVSTTLIPLDSKTKGNIDLPAVEPAKAEAILDRMCRWASRAVNEPLPFDVQMMGKALHEFSESKNDKTLNQILRDVAQSYDPSARSAVYTGRFYPDSESLGDLNELAAASRDIYAHLFTTVRPNREAALSSLFNQSDTMEKSQTKGAADE